MTDKARMGMLGTGFFMAGAGLMIAGIACMTTVEQPAKPKRVRKSPKAAADLAAEFETAAAKAGPVAVRPKRQPDQAAKAARKSAPQASRQTSAAVRPN